MVISLIIGNCLSWNFNKTPTILLRKSGPLSRCSFNVFPLVFAPASKAIRTLLSLFTLVTAWWGMELVILLLLLLFVWFNFLRDFWKYNLPLPLCTFLLIVDHLQTSFPERIIVIKLSFYCLETLRELRLSANFQTRKLCENNGVLH